MALKILKPTVVTTLIFISIYYFIRNPETEIKINKNTDCNQLVLKTLDEHKFDEFEPDFEINEKPFDLRYPESVQKSFIKYQLEKSEEAYQVYVKKRKFLVGSDPSKVNPWPPQWVMYYWDYFLPSFSCPHFLERIGGLGDGGKWVCGFHLYETPPKISKLTKYPTGLSNPEKNPEPCLVYSFGVAHESSFEAEILKRTDCSIYAYDASVRRMGPQIKWGDPRVNFKQLYVGAKTENDSMTLKDLLAFNGHDWIDFLKIDIEMAEVEVLNQIIDDFEILPFGQMQIELHTDQEGSNFASVYKLWERMEQKGLRAFKNEVNHWPCVRVKMRPMYVEYSFINIKGHHRLLSPWSFKKFIKNNNGSKNKIYFEVK